MAGTTQATSAAIATLMTLVEGIDRRMIEDRAITAKDREEAQAIRAEMQVELQRLRIHAESMDARLSKVEPVTDMVTGWKFMAAGALGLIGIFGGAMIGLLKFMGITFGGNSPPAP